MGETAKLYYQLAKPGIVYGNLMAAVSGFLFACVTAKQFDLLLLLAVTTGIACVIGSACVFNNYLDRHIDKHMTRTKKRALVNGTIATRGALVFAAVLGILGFLLLLGTNGLTVWLGVLAIVMYVLVYGWAKRKSVFGTLVGSVPGALPPVAGYTAVTGTLDAAAVIIFAIMVCWQMAHFYAIAMFRHDEYAAAGIPVWPIKKGMRSTKLQILFFVGIFIIVNALLTLFGFTGIIYLVTMSAVGIGWLWRGWRGLTVADDIRWARKMFFLSLLVLLIFSAALPLGALFP